jgi:hypothetical protein
MFEVERKDLLNLGQSTYNAIKDNPNIPNDIKESWVEVCVSSCDIKELTNY